MAEARKIQFPRKPANPAGFAIERWRGRALAAERRSSELEVMLAAERTARKRDTRILYRTLQAFSDARGAALSKSGSPGIVDVACATYNGPFEEFAEWWLATGCYVESERE